MTELLILIFAALLLIGSISIAMPSKASREISKLRMSAKLLGCNITSTLYGKNTFKNKVNLIFIPFLGRHSRRLPMGSASNVGSTPF